MRSFFALTLPLLLISCEKEPKTADELRAAMAKKSNDENALRMERLEGKIVFILEMKPRKKGERLPYATTPVFRFHLRKDCPEMAEVLDNFDMKAVTAKNKELVDEKGFFYRDKSPCEKCVP